MKIIDISMKVDPSIIVYPGNPSPEIKRYSSIPTNVTNETRIIIGSHTGTHVDAGLHVLENGYTSDEIPLESLYGPCRVIDVTDCGDSIDRDDLVKFHIKPGEIIILKTENSRNTYAQFRKEFAHISRSGAEYLVERKVRTVGIDYLSVKKFNEDNEVHILLISNMTVFEGLYLVNVLPGKYTFAGLPIKVSLDGAPARAILIRDAELQQ